MDGIFLLCCRSCLRGDDNSEYYSLLDIDKRSDVESIKKAYKKASLNLHPDKLAQKGITQTAEHREQFLKVKEAYDVLVDPKRRKLYDELGASGLKLIESPQEVNPADLIKNFQKNKADRCTLALLFLFVILSLLVLPVLFSLKCDGLNIPWTALWTPMWIVDFIWLCSVVVVCKMKGKKDKNSESNNASLEQDMMEDENDEYGGEGPTFHEKVFNFISTITFVLAQIFILMRLDENIKWNWFAVFAPWFIYEANNVLAILISGHAFSTIRKPSEQVDTSVNNEEHGDDFFHQKVTEEMEYFKKMIMQSQDRKQIIVSHIRAWFAIFLAVKSNHTVDWNWGLVLLPVWVYIFATYIEAYMYRQWGKRKIQENVISEDEVNVDPLRQTKSQHGAELLSVSQSSCVFTTIGPLLIALLLVCRLEVSTYSTFIIIIPIFVAIGCCFCVTFGVICCLSNVDTDSLENSEDIEINGKNTDEEAPPAMINEEIYAPPPPPPTSTYIINEEASVLLPSPPTTNSNDID